MSSEVAPARRNPRRWSSFVIACVVAVAFGAPSAAGTTARGAAAAPAAVIAVQERGLNLLHEDFRLPPGARPAWPRNLPPFKRVNLPKRGTFEERLQQARSGTLGNLDRDQLYYVVGTRVFLYASARSVFTDATADRWHGTGVASSAIGREHGTNPDAFLVFVLGRDVEGWKWLAQQRWIDAVSTSYWDPYGRGVPGLNCGEVGLIREIVEQGRLVFTAMGNGEQFGHAMFPSGVPEAYQVGGVDDSGRTYRPLGEQQNTTPNRPYETGDRFSFESADADSLSGSMLFGGTSGAAPSTAGRATELLQHARRLLGSSRTGVREGALARGQPARVPGRGPLADGDLTDVEIVDLLHHTAIPAEAPSPGRYLIEGYGALSDESVAHAKEVLDGGAEPMSRPEEDAAHDTVEAMRQAVFTQPGCG